MQVAIKLGKPNCVTPLVNKLPKLVNQWANLSSQPDDLNLSTLAGQLIGQRSMFDQLIVDNLIVKSLATTCEGI